MGTAPSTQRTHSRSRNLSGGNQLQSTTHEQNNGASAQLSIATSTNNTTSSSYKSHAHADRGSSTSNNNNNNDSNLHYANNEETNRNELTIGTLNSAADGAKQSSNLGIDKIEIKSIVKSQDLNPQPSHSSSASVVQNASQNNTNTLPSSTVTSSSSNPSTNSNRSSITAYVGQAISNRLSLSPGRRYHSGSGNSVGATATIQGGGLSIGSPIVNGSTSATISGNGNHNGTGNNIHTDDKSDSSSSGNTDDGGEKAALWCYLKAKTRVHDSSKVLRRTMWFEAKEGNTLRIGRGDDCELKLEDDRCVPLNARLSGVVGENRFLTLHPEARVYRLVGMGLKRGSISAPLALGSIIKLGSVSLEVTSLCTEERDNLYERFSTEMKQASNERQNQTKTTERKGSKLAIKKPSTPANQTAANRGDNALSANTQSNANAESTIESPAALNNNAANATNIESSTVEKDNSKRDVKESETKDHQPDLEGDDLPSDKEDEEDEVIGDGKPLHILPEVTDPRDEMCYICWGGPSEEDLRGDLKNPNPLIRNPCGKCSGSSRYVHLECILRWIKTNGSGHCSVCNGALPTHFSSPPPNIELKVVRHRRGQAWVGTRRFRVSFAEKEHALIGRDSECDVKLPDRSVCSTHSRIVFDKKTRTFMIQDCASVSGTYLQISQDMQLDVGSTNYLKIGRTIISLRVSERRRSLRDFLPRISRALSR